jgi:hypothetical protein
MNLTERDLEEFSSIWKEEFHEDIPAKYARQRASEILELYTVLARSLATEIKSLKTNEVLPLLPQIE